MFYKITVAFLTVFFKCLYGLEIRGREVFPKDGSFILASNHESHLDPPVMSVVSPRQLFFLAKEELFQNFWFALLIRSLGAFPVKRGTSDMRSMRRALRSLKTGALLLFPQGTREGNWEDVKLGVGFLCKKAGVPIIAARITGTDYALPKGSRNLRRCKIRVVCTKVDNILPQDTYEQITDKVVDTINSL